MNGRQTRVGDVKTKNELLSLIEPACFMFIHLDSVLHTRVYLTRSFRSPAVKNQQMFHPEESEFY